MPEKKCLNCGLASDTVFLLRGEYGGEEKWVCVRCLPILIHGAH